jgi:Mce-associated membrane protein
VTPAAGAGQGGRRRVAGERGRSRGDAAARPEAPPAPARTTSGPSFVTPAARPAATVPPGARPSGAAVRETPDAPAGTARGRRTALLVVAAVAALLLVVAASVVVALDRQQQRVADARAAALEQARTSAETVLSYSHRSLDDDFAAALALSTGQFEEDYERTSQSAVREVATETEAEVRADVVSAGVVSGTADRVVVLLFVDQTTVSNRLDRPQTDQNRVRLTMVRSTADDGPEWLVEQVDAL